MRFGSKSGVATSGAPSPSVRPEDIGGSGSPRPTTTRPGEAAAVTTLPDFARSGIAKSDFVESDLDASSLGGSNLDKSGLADPDFATSDLPGCGLDGSGLDESDFDKLDLDKSALDVSALIGPGFGALGFGELGLNEPDCDRPDLGSSNSPKSSADKSNLAAPPIGPVPGGLDGLSPPLDGPAGGGLGLSVFLLELSGAVCGCGPATTRWRAGGPSGRSPLATGREDSEPLAGCSADLPNVGPLPDEPRGLAGSRPLP